VKLSARTKPDLEKELQEFDARWWDGLPAKGSLNAYKCQTCGRVIFTIDMDKGVTPMYMSCKIESDCKGTMVSSGYPKVPAPEDWEKNFPVWCWYRPEAGPLGLFHEDQIVDEYIRRGGLLLRERGK